MANRKSLGNLITKYAFLEIIYTFFILLVSYTIFNLLIYNGYIYPASFAETNVSKVEDIFYGDDFETSKIPYYYDYIYKVDGKIKKYTIAEKDRDEVRKAVKEQSSRTNSFFDPISITVLENNRQTLILTYRIKPIFSNSNLYRKFPNIETPYIILSLAIWSLGFMLIVRKSISLIRREIDKITQTNMEIKNKNLDYSRKNSAYAEINEVLDSIDQMAGDLKGSLKDQWKIETEQRELIESVTHDIRTPITLIKGNLELLSEEVESERIKDIENGVRRLEAYIEKLKTYSKNPQNKKPVDRNVINDLIKSAGIICKNNNRNLIVGRDDSSSISLDIEAVHRASQNLLKNSIENSNPSTNIYMDFIDEEDTFTISIKDQGTGFKKDLLKTAKKRYVTSKKDKTEPHGLGLSIVDEIARANKGKLILSNYKNEKESGAVVKLVFYK